MLEVFTHRSIGEKQTNNFGTHWKSNKMIVIATLFLSLSLIHCLEKVKQVSSAQDYTYNSRLPGKSCLIDRRMGFKRPVRFVGYVRPGSMKISNRIEYMQCQVKTSTCKTKGH